MVLDSWAASCCFQEFLKLRSLSKQVSDIGNKERVSTNTFSQRMVMVESSSLEFLVPC